MQTYTQVYKGDIYTFITDEELIDFTKTLDKEGVSYSTQVSDTYKVTIL